jgi:hypothetical protein
MRTERDSKISKWKVAFNKPCILKNDLLEPLTNPSKVNRRFIIINGQARDFPKD